MPSESPYPNKILNEFDRGDDIQKRYRYQAAYAAEISLDLLSEDSEFEEIFCEQHEDILVKRKDNTFIGIQVKTRNPSLGPFTFSNPEIMKSLKRFIESEKKFPNKFKNYVICSNCGFWQRKKNASNLVHCLNLIRERDNSKSFLSIVDFSNRIKTLSNVTNCDEDYVLDVLSKVRTQESSDLERYEVILADTIANVTGNSDQSYDVLQKAANSLIETLLRAASLSHGSPRTSYFALLESPDSEKVDSIIQKKRITADIVQKVINESLNPITPLQKFEHIDISDLPKGMKKMELKMAKGGLSAQNIGLAKDLKYSAESLLIGWSHKYGLKETEKRYQYLSVLVRSECQEVYDSTRIPNRLFGNEMLVEVRKRLRERHSREIQSQYNDCLYEHLVGIVWILTEECGLWWSEVFEISEEAIL